MTRINMTLNLLGEDWKDNNIYQRQKQAHLQFTKANAQTKNCKRACFANAPRHCKQWTTEQRQTEHQLVTAPTQKAGFRVPKTVLWLIKH